MRRICHLVCLDIFRKVPSPSPRFGSATEAVLVGDSTVRCADVRAHKQRGLSGESTGTQILLNIRRLQCTVRFCAIDWKASSALALEIWLGEAVRTRQPRPAASTEPSPVLSSVGCKCRGGNFRARIAHRRKRAAALQGYRGAILHLP